MIVDPLLTLGGTRRGQGLQIGRVGKAQPLLERNPVTPTERVDARNVEQLPRRTIGFPGVERDLTAVTDNLRDLPCQFADGNVLAGSDVDGLADICGIAALHQEHRRPLRGRR
jgi:hypothetical protein